MKIRDYNVERTPQETREKVRIWLDKKELAINFSMEIVDIGAVFWKMKMSNSGDINRC